MLVLLGIHGMLERFWEGLAWLDRTKHAMCWERESLMVNAVNEDPDKEREEKWTWELERRAWMQNWENRRLTDQKLEGSSF